MVAGPARDIPVVLGVVDEPPAPLVAVREGAQLIDGRLAVAPAAAKRTQRDEASQIGREEGRKHGLVEIDDVEVQQPVFTQVAAAVFDVKIAAAPNRRCVVQRRRRIGNPTPRRAC
jgi:hypothetical protein